MISFGRGDAPDWILRISFAIHAVGLGILYLWHPLEQESAVFSVLLFDWGWPEATAMRVESWGMWLTVLTGCASPALCFLPAPPRNDMLMSLGGGLRIALRWTVQGALGVAVLWEILMAVAAMIRRDSYMAEWTLAFHALRIMVPLAIVLGTFEAPRWILREVLRWGTMVTTLSHGYEAYRLAPEFCNLILLTARNLLAADWTERFVHRCLRVIAVWDLNTSVALAFVRPWRSEAGKAARRNPSMRVGYWICGVMAFWGLVTALSRTTAYGWLMFPETLIRAVHVGGPAALIWYLDPPRSPDHGSL